MRSRHWTRKYVFISCIFVLAPFVYGGSDTKETTAAVDFPRKASPTAEEVAAQNCSEAAVNQFPKSCFTSDERRSGWLVLHVMLAIYMCVCLITLCDDYFIPAIAILTESLGINDGVAGGAFMAGASSVPAIVASLIAIIVAKGDLGVSTALGSAVLNTAGVVGAGALFAGKMVMLSRWPLYRDTVFCFVSMLVLVITMYDSIIMWYESTLLLVFYFAYIIIMVYDEELRMLCEAKFSFLRERPLQNSKELPCLENDSIADNAAPIAMTLKGFDHARDLQRLRLSGRKINEFVSVEGSRKTLFPKGGNTEGVPPSEGVAIEPNHGQKPDTKSEPNTKAKAGELSGGLWSYIATELEPPSSKLRLFPWILYLPFTLLFVFTIPNCIRDGFRKWFGITLFMSTVYITAGSYLLVWMIAVIGFTLGIPDAAMGLTFLAVGVTLPDVVIGVISTRRGHPDIATSNAIASNIVEILAGLALPWLVKTIVITPGEPIVLESRGALWFTVYLLLSLGFLLVLTHLCKWTLTKRYGTILLTWYIVFLFVSVLHEMGYLGGEKLIVCPSSY